MDNGLYSACTAGAVGQYPAQPIPCQNCTPCSRPGACLGQLDLFFAGAGDIAWGAICDPWCAEFAAILESIVVVDAATGIDLIRLELQKTNVFSIIDKYEISDAIAKDTSLRNCFSKQCMVKAGNVLHADKMVSGSLETFGQKIVITLRLVDVKTETIEKTDVKEFMNLPEQIQNMVQISVKSLLDLPNDPLLLNTLVYYQTTANTPTTFIRNSGPRMGVAYVTGDIGQRLMDKRSIGGFDGYPIMSQFGYQSEVSYLSAGNVNALFEALFLVNGLEQQLFLPSITIMNGFRDNKHGWEVAFGPVFSLNKKAEGYYENNDSKQAWHLKADWNPYDTATANQYTPEYVDRIDNRGNLTLSPGWVWAIGKTFRSGYLNIPVNGFVVPRKEGWYYGLSVGFNVRKKGVAKK